MTGALSSHYARALADSVFREGSEITPQDALRQFAGAEALISGSKDLQLALLSPAVNRARKVAVVTRLADELGLARTLRNFLLVIVTHRRTHELKAIRQSFEEVVDERSGWVRAEVTSAYELDAGQRQEVEQALGTKLGKFIHASYTTDPTLLAGVRARVAAKEYDATLKGKLEGLRQRLQTGF